MGDHQRLDAGASREPPDRVRGQMVGGEMLFELLLRGGWHVRRIARDIGQRTVHVDHLADQQVRALGQFFDRRAGAGVTGIDDRPAGQVEAQRERLVVAILDAAGGEVIMAVLRGGDGHAVELDAFAIGEFDHVHGLRRRSPRLAGNAVADAGGGLHRGDHARDQLARAGRAVDGEGFVDVGLVAQAKHRRQAAGVIDMEVAEEHRLDCGQEDACSRQLLHRAVARIDQIDTPVMGQRIGGLCPVPAGDRAAHRAERDEAIPPDRRLLREGGRGRHQCRKGQPGETRVHQKSNPRRTP